MQATINNTMAKSKVELMAPAGNFESMQAAMDNGADSVYFGIEQMNMRARASMNFTLDDLPEIARRCGENNVRTYLTLNTIVYNHDLSLVKRIIDAVKSAGITAVIAADQAVLSYAKTVGVEVHISTQVNITNIEAVKFYAHFADVMVLSRELSLRQVKEICDGVVKEDVRGPAGKLIEIEVFGHGALCMAVSGKCFLSLHTQNSSANRGACIQNCRRTYRVIDIEDGHELEIDNEYIMSPKDLCTIDFVDQLVDGGISVLKIEGRGRAPEYVATTIKCYREALDSIAEGTYTKEKVKDWFTRLESVYNRGFWGGYFLGQKMGEWSDTPGSLATQKKVYLGKGGHFYPKTNIAEFQIEAQNIKVGDEYLITGPNTGVMEGVIESMMVNDEFVEQAKRGDTVTFKVKDRVRQADKLYKMIPNPDLQ